MDIKNSVAEDIEGLGDAEDASWDYPIDTVLIRNETRTVHDVLRRIGQGSFVMNPDFQRDFIWSEDKQSKLIESVLMRIPLPVFYLAEDDLGRMVVVDGLQRLSTFQRFVNNELQLKLPEHAELNNKRFQTSLPSSRTVWRTVISFCTLSMQKCLSEPFWTSSSASIRVPLTRQQMRNCLYMGHATHFLKTEAATELFREATGESLDTSTMRDREFVNRFCAFQLLPLDDYRGDMDDFLARALKYMNTCDMP